MSIHMQTFLRGQPLFVEAEQELLTAGFSSWHGHICEGIAAFSAINPLTSEIVYGHAVDHSFEQNALLAVVRAARNLRAGRVLPVQAA